MSGTLCGKPVVLLQCGIGKVNAAAGAALMLANFPLSAIINTGSAGGLDKALKIGDTIIASQLVHNDVDVTGFGYAPGQVPKHPAMYVSDAALQNAALECASRLKAAGELPAETNYVRAQICSGDSFVCRDDQLEKIRASFPDAKAVDMEAAAIAQTAYLFGVKFLCVRALSDIAGTESPITFD